MTNRLYVDIKTDCNGNLTGPVKFPADGTFVFEAVLLVIEEFAKSVGKPANEVIQDMYSFSKKQDGSATTATAQSFAKDVESLHKLVYDYNLVLNQLAQVVKGSMIDEFNRDDNGIENLAERCSDTYVRNELKLHAIASKQFLKGIV